MPVRRKAAKRKNTRKQKVFLMAILVALFVVALPLQAVFAETGSEISGTASQDNYSQSDPTQGNDTENNQDSVNGTEVIDGQEGAAEQEDTDEQEVADDQGVADDQDTADEQEEVTEEQEEATEEQEEVTEEQDEVTDGQEDSTEQTESTNSQNDETTNPEDELPEIATPSLQDAINALATQTIEDKTIYVDGGIYNESIIIDASLQPYLNGIELRASGNGGIPVINGDVLLSNLIGFVLEGFQVVGNITVQDSQDGTITGTVEDDELKIIIQGEINNLTVNGGGGNDVIDISGNVANTSPSQDDSGLSPEQYARPPTPGISINGNDGDDHLLVDFSKGNPIPWAGLSYDGGADYDVITVSGGSFGKTSYRAINSHSGTIEFDDSLITYSNIEPIVDNTSSGEVTFYGTDGNDTILIFDSIDSDETNSIEDGTRIIKVESPDENFENVIFTNLTIVVIDGADGDDLINIAISEPTPGLTSLTIRGGNGFDRIENLDQDILLDGVDLTLESEVIKINGGTIRGKNISLISETIAGGLNLFADVENLIDLDNVTINATGSILLKASGKQLKPTINNGILTVKQTNAEITVTDCELSADGNIEMQALAELDLELNGFLLTFPLEITLAAANTNARVLVDGATTLTADGNISLSAISKVNAASLAQSKGEVGSITYAISAITTVAEALIQGAAAINTQGLLFILAQNDVQVDTIANGCVENDSSSGAGTIAVAAVETTTRAGILENALIIYSANLDIISQARNEIKTAAQAAGKGPSEGSNSSIKNLLSRKDADGNFLISESLQNEICALLDEIAAGVEETPEGEGGGGSGEEGSAVQVAGAFAFGKIRNITEALLGSSALVKTAGLLNIASQALTNCSVLASGMTNAGDVGIGAAIAILDAQNTNKALIEESAQIQAGNITISALSEDFAPENPEQVDSINDFRAAAYAGQSAGNVGVAGALSFNLVISKTEASIGENANVTLINVENNGDITIVSSNNNNIETIANGAPASADENATGSFFNSYKDGEDSPTDDRGESSDGEESSGEVPSVGVGAAIAITIADISSLAWIHDNASILDANDISLRSDMSGEANTEGAAGADGGKAAAPVMALTVLLTQSRAGFGRGGKLSFSGNIESKANGSSKSNIKATAKAAGSGVAVGAAIGINVHNNETLAITSRSLYAGGNIVFHAKGTTRGTSTAEAGANGAGGESGTAGRTEESGDDDGDGDPDSSEGGVDKQVNKGLELLDKISKEKGIEKTEEDKVPETTPQKAETSEGGVNVAAAVTLNIVTAITEAYIPKDITVGCDGTLTIEALSDTDTEAKADGSATKAEGADDPKVGVGAAVAINVATAITHAYIAAGAEITAGAVAIKAGMIEIPGENEEEDPVTPETNKHNVEAISGAGASNVGVAGALAINILVNDVKALTGGDITILESSEANGEVSLSAESQNEGTVTAGASVEGLGEDSKVGVGASVAINIIVNTLIASVEDNAEIKGAKGLSINANLSNNTETTANAGATSNSAVSVNGAVATAVIINTAQALIGIIGEAADQEEEQARSINGDISVAAINTNSVKTKASGIAAGSKVGVGIALALNVVTDVTTATTNRDLTATGDVTFSAEGASSSSAVSEAGTNGGSTEAPAEKDGGEAGEESGVDKEVNKQLGFVDKICGDKGLDTKDTEDDKDDSKVPSKTPQSAATSEGGIDVAAAVALNILTSVSQAYIPENIKIDTDSNITLKVNGNTDSEAKADGSAVKETAEEGEPSKVGVGVAVAINVVTNIKEAYIAQGAEVEAQGLTIKVGMTEIESKNAEDETVTDDTNTHVVEAISGAGASSVGVAGSVAINVVVNTVLAHNDGSVTLSYTDENGDIQYGDAEISAESKNESTTIAGATVIAQGEEGSAGVGASFATNIIANIIEAYIADGAILTGAKDLTISASLDNTTLTEASAGAQAEADASTGVSVNGAVALAVVVNDVKAQAGTPGTIPLEITGNLILQATNINRVNTKASGKALGSKVGVGLAVALNVVVDNTIATTSRALIAGGDITFKAQGATSSSAVAEAGVNGGETGESGEGEDQSKGTDGTDGSDEEGDVDKKVNKHLDFLNKTSEEKGIDSKEDDDPTDGKDETKVPSKTPQKAETSEGSIDVGAAVVINIVTTINQAYIPKELEITSGGTLSIEASGNTDSEAKADGSAVKEDPDNPTNVGVGVAVAINVVTILNQAYIAEDTIVEAQGLKIKVGMTEIAGTDAEGNPTTDDTNTHVVEAISGAGAANVGVAGSAAINVVVNTVLAYNDGFVTLSYTDEEGVIQYGDAEISAISKNSSTTKAGATVIAQGEEGSAGVGASFATNIIANIIEAYIEDGAILTGAKDLTISASLDNTTITEASAGAQAEANASTGVSVNGAVALAVVVNDVKAQAGTEGAVPLEITGDLTLQATNNNRVNTKASGKALGSKVGVGVAVALNVVVDNTIATTSRALKADGNITLRAQGATSNSAVAEAGVNGAGGESEESGTAEKSGTTEEGGESKDGEGTEEEGGVDKEVNKNLEFLNKISEEKGIDSKDEDGKDEGKVPSKTPQKAETSEGSIDVGAAVVINIVTTINQAYIPKELEITSGGTLTLEASGNTDSEAKADGSAVKEDPDNPTNVGVGVAVAINVVTIVNQAYIAQGTQSVEAKGLSIKVGMTEIESKNAEGETVIDDTNTHVVEAISGAGELT
jgi:cell division protein FtsN